MLQDKAPSKRPVRSFVRRAGRMTAAQQRALDTLWPEFGLDYTAAPLDLAHIFGRGARRVMEIGFGNGDVLVKMAKQHPDWDFIGVEVHEPGVGHCLLGLREAKLSNVRVVCHDATEVLNDQITDLALNQVNLFFPDPWPKKRHHKRRLVQPDFIEMLAIKLAADGIFHAATDWAPYGKQIEDILTNSEAFEVTDLGSEERIKTRFEQRGERLGHDILELAYRRI